MREPRELEIGAAAAPASPTRLSKSDPFWWVSDAVLYKELGRLPEDQGLVLGLRFLFDLSSKEIGRVSELL